MKLLNFYKSENKKGNENLFSSQNVLKEHELKQIKGGGGEDDGGVIDEIIEWE
ncbi:MAG: hypothetical protein K8R54_15980 [Bacteroidales bacterium]|nr:hypothetical protein [Bacteroidales bacterium]